MRGLKKTLDKIKEAESIAIVCHINPDGDCIGSLLALGLGLEKLGKKVYFVSADGVPKRYRFLGGASKIARKIKGEVDLAISVDSNTKEMLGSAFKIFKQAKSTIEIDHHQVREPFADIELIDAEASAVGEQIFLLLGKLKIEIGHDIAQNILTSLIVETNSFRLPNVRPYTFKVCEELVKTGVDFYSIANNVFWVSTKEKTVLSGLCLSRCKFLKKDKIVWSIIRRKDFEKTRGKDEDVDAVADEMRAIRDVKIAVLFREKPNNKLRISLRSKDNINVAGVAQLYNGGGHLDVAGCSVDNRPGIIKELLGHLQKLV